MMKGKIPLFLYVLSFLLTIFSFYFTYLSVSSYDDQISELLSIKEKKKEFIELAKTERSENLSKLSREKARKEELSMKIESLREDLRLAETEFQKRKESILQFEEQIKAKEDRVLIAREAVAEIQVRKKQILIKASELATQIPTLENKLSAINNEKQTASLRVDELSEKISGYDLITSQLRKHHSSALKSIRKYHRDRPWIEKGDSISTTFHSFDLGTGTLAIPFGLDAGIQKGMLFSVKSDDNEICKIKITNVEAHRSLGAILPLYGSFAQLREATQIDLINL